MGISDIKFSSIYKAVDLPSDNAVYGYIRGRHGSEVGFSVLDEPLNDPDFSDCGIFWVAPEDFISIFEVYR